MTLPAEGRVNCPQEIPLLTYTVQGIRMGTDADQIDAMLDLKEAASKGLSVCYLDDTFRFSALPAAYRSPRVLTMKGRPGCGVVIDEPDEIVSVSVKDIRPLPALVASCGSPKVIWGVLIAGESIVLLIDLLKIGQTGAGPIRFNTIDNNNRRQS